MLRHPGSWKRWIWLEMDNFKIHFKYKLVEGKIKNFKFDLGSKNKKSGKQGNN